MEREPVSGSLRLAEVIASLSLAIDLGSGVSMETMLRSAVLAVRLGEMVGLSEEELAGTYYLAMLRFVGCTSDAHTAASIFGDEIAARTWFAPVGMGSPPELLGAVARNMAAGEPPLRRARKLAGALMAMPQMMNSINAHCEVGERLAVRLGLDECVQEGLGQVFERWDGKGRPRKLKGEAIARPVRVVLLAQDALIHYRLGAVDAAVAMARQRAGSMHDPVIAERFCQEATTLLTGIDEGSAWDAALAIEPGPRPALSEVQLDTAVHAMADFTDLKSPWLTGHSAAVGELAGAAAERCGLSHNEVTNVRRAGYLHDLGRTGISSAIWGKTGPLSEMEWERVRLHSYYTERVLARSRPLAALGALAGSHHERLDGGGYHRGVPVAMLAQSARILAAADAYQAMTEPRPHRPARSPDQAADELRRDVRAGRLDGDAAGAVLSAAGHQGRTARREWPAGLTEREVDVLRLLARGHSTREMAGTLVLSQKTVDHHIQNIYGKIGVSTRAAATLFAMQHALVLAATPVPSPA